MGTRPHDSAASGAPQDVGIAPEGFRAPPQTSVGRVRLQVADLDRSLGFYRDLLGFHVLDPSGNGRDPSSEVDSGGSRGNSRSLGAPPTDSNAGSKTGSEPRPLIELIERPGATPVPPRGRLGLFHFAVLLPSRAALGRLMGHLANAPVRVGSADHLVSEALYLSDPDGLGIEIYADRPRDAWRRSGDEVAIATEPLDARGLMEAAGGAAWEGVPVGTTMGHIHFSVDDLSTAEAFFHVGLGLDKVAWSYPGALFLSAGGYHHHVGTNVWGRGAAKATEDDARLLEWRLVYPDADAISETLQNLANAGFANTVDGSGGRLVDPWGTGLRLDTRA